MIMSAMYLCGEKYGACMVPPSSGLTVFRNHFVSEVKRALELSDEYSSRFNGHSFRIGAASMAAARGSEDSVIKTLGIWESEAYQRYIKISKQDLAQFCKTKAN